jgi:hypothetical protein
MTFVNGELVTWVVSVAFPPSGGEVGSACLRANWRHRWRKRPPRAPVSQCGVSHYGISISDCELDPVAFIPGLHRLQGAAG